MYSYDIIKEYNEKFIDTHKKELKCLSEKERKALDFVMYGADDSFDRDSKYYVEIKRQHIDVLSEFVKREYGKVVEILVPSEFVNDFYRACDNMVRYQYSRSYYRRSYRSRDVFPHAQRIFKLMNYYYIVGRLGLSIGNLKPIVCDEWEDDIKRSVYLSLRYTDTFIAERINSGDEEVIGILHDMITSENNTNVLSYRCIRSVIMSDNTELHTLLCGLLVAARLQEGLRQSICESADCGTIAAFISILNTIKDNNLIRFPAVKRAVATWCGICWEGEPDRTAEKVLDDMVAAVKSRENCMELINTTDAVHIYCGLWGLSFYDIADAMNVILELRGCENDVQLLTIGYFMCQVEIKSITYRIASEVIETHPLDTKVFAMYYPMYIYYNYSCKNDYRHIDQYAKPFFKDKSAAQKHYDIMDGLYRSMSKKKIEYAPFVFPWLSGEITKSRILQCMLGAAIILNDEDKLCSLGERMTDFDVDTRSDIISVIGVVLKEKGSDNQSLRNIVIKAVADKGGYTRSTSLKILCDLKMSDSEYQIIEGFAKYKSADIRSGVLELLKKRSPSDLKLSILRMMTSKEENIRLAALDLLMFAMSEYKDDDFSKSIAAAGSIESPTDRERILINEIVGKKDSEELNAENGYGLYDTNTSIAPANVKPDIKIVQKFFSVPHKELVKMELDLMSLIEENSNLEFTGYNGEERLLGNFGSLPCKWSSVAEERARQKIWEVTPFHELWAKYYRESIKTPQRFWSLYLYHNRDRSPASLSKESQKHYDKTQKEVFGTIADFDYDKELGVKDKRFLESSFSQLRSCVLDCILSEFELELPYEVVQNCVLYFVRCLDMDTYILTRDNESKRPYWYSQPALYLSKRAPSLMIAKLAGYIEKDFDTNFRILHELLLKEHEINNELESRHLGGSSNLTLGIYTYLTAFAHGIITKDDIYKIMFEYIGLPKSISSLSSVTENNLSYYTRRDIEKILEIEGKKLTENDEIPKDSDLYRNSHEVLSNVIELVLNTELKRGDSETVFTHSVPSIKKIYGIDRLMEILKALGNETLKARSYYYSGTMSKKESLGHLLSVCYPAEGETAEIFSKKAKESHISDERLIEVAMFAVQWIDFIGEHLGIEGFRSGCYYFMAHTAEFISDKRFAIIAKYTPLTKEELNGGCFDAKWFMDVYTQLGDKLFERIYKSAKYISSSNMHTRARKFADAALGKMDIAETENIIRDKRNKDLLLALGIIPSKENADILQRYEFIQAFLKQSKKFGAQRRQSEGEAVKYALKNLAAAAGYSDETRLTLSMETELVRHNKRFFDKTSIGEYEVQIVVDKLGKPSMTFEKKGKALKSTPAPLKKNEEFLEVKEFYEKLKQQYSRTVKMFELAMEECSKFTLGELNALCENPVTRCIMESLVFVTTGDEYICGFIDNGVLIDEKGTRHKFDNDTLLRAAHPYDLYKKGVWSDFQSIVLERGSNEGKFQPFRQVFRELYVKLPEESEKTMSLMFTGYQIQASRTVGALKTRRWVADYEDGLQKIYYDDNVIASLYAVADWFSPADIEAPTIDGVCFYDRKTYAPLKISEIPDIIYSEVMRDVDLAVSVAHAGGVDPETSHSTIEMRSVIVDYNVKLFGLKNVSVDKNHIMIDGKWAKYTIHLGSGVIHMVGGHQINVVAVSSGKKSKIFLPFLDEDPKTAEIITKMLMFSNDDKIKDPFIMRQIKA
ncbi:MAG: DUF4132 domain-containing protein [Clostridia bacterium]|nr:DUF4132 domain-containing protein [Clostridia bacterium]